MKARIRAALRLSTVAAADAPFGMSGTMMIASKGASDLWVAMFKRN